MIEQQLKEIGDFIRAMRLTRKFSQRFLGHLVGVSGSTISAIERGKSSLNLKLLLKIAEALGFCGKIRFCIKTEKTLFDETSLQQ